MIENVNICIQQQKRNGKKKEKRRKRILKKLQDDEMDYVDFLGLTETDKNAMSTYGKKGMV